MLIDVLPPNESVPSERIRRLKRVELEELAKHGFFDDERVELLTGVVVEMAPPSVEHDESVAIVHEILRRHVGDRARIRSQTSYAATEDSLPRPDCFVVPAQSYWHARPDHAFLVVEVSRTSRATDRGVKRAIYAAGNVEEYWIVDHVKRVVEVYRDPLDGRDSLPAVSAGEWRRGVVDGDWRSLATDRIGDEIAMLRFPDVRVAVADILPPAGDG